MEPKGPGRKGKKALIFWPYNAFPPVTGTHQVQLADMTALRALGYEIAIFGSACAMDSSGASWNDVAVKVLRERLGSGVAPL